MSSLTSSPLTETPDTVTLRRADYDRLLDAYEDRRDLATFTRYVSAVETLGEAEVRRLCYTEAEVDRMLEGGVSPVTIWRERAGLSGRGLALQARISQSYLVEIESGKKPGSAAALKALATALKVPMEYLVD